MPIGLVAAGSVFSRVRDFLDPCLQWGENSGSVASLPPPSAHPAPCATRVSATSETRRGAVVQLLLAPGGILLAVALGIIGAVRARQGLVVSAAVLLFVEAFIAFSVAPLALLAGFVFLWSASKLLPSRAGV